MSETNVLKLHTRGTPGVPPGEALNLVQPAAIATPLTAPGPGEPISVRLADLVEGISDGFSLYDPQDRLVLWNEKFANILHYAKDIMVPGVRYEALVQKCAFEHFVNQEVAHEEKEAWIQECFRFHRNLGTYERVTADGTCYLVSRRRSGEGYTAVVWTNITERKQAEEALRRSEHLYRELFEGSLQGIVIQTASKILKFNRAFIRIFGLAAEDQFKTPRDLERIVAPHERNRVRQLMRDRFAAKSGSADYEFQGVRIDGKPVWVQATATAILWSGEPALQTSYHDITQRKEFEEELLSKKLETVGTMAHGIAMEFHKVQSAVMSAVRLAKMEAYAAGLDRVTERLTEAEKLGASGADLVQQLLVLHRGGTPVKEHTTVEELLRESLPLSGAGRNVLPLHKNRPKLKIEIGRTLWPVCVDKGQLIGVLRSLIDNGMAAMPFGGTLEIAAENVTLEGKAKGIPLPAGKYVKIGISDQGRGVAEDSLERIFDPYFSPHQRKSGLAMASAYSVVKHHGGALTVLSRSGRGTRMNLFLPAVQARSGAEGG